MGLNDDPYDYERCDYPPACRGAPNPTLAGQYMSLNGVDLALTSSPIGNVSVGLGSGVSGVSGGVAAVECAQGRVSNVTRNRLCSKCRIGWMPASSVEGECLPCGVEDGNGSDMQGEN